MSAPHWLGATEELHGLTFGALTVEAPALPIAEGARVTCRCACGRIAVRLVTELRSGAAVACKRCVTPIDAFRRARGGPRPGSGRRAKIPPHATPIQARLRGLLSLQRCSACGERGHNRRNCGVRG